MRCNSCARPFTLLLKDKGCPSCGYSYCSKCLQNLVFVEKLNKKAKVCNRCKDTPGQKSNQQTKVEPPDVYYKRLATINPDAPSTSSGQSSNATDKEIEERLRKLKVQEEAGAIDEIADRLAKLKDTPSTSTAELETRLAKLRGCKDKSPGDLIREEAGAIDEIADRLAKLKDTPSTSTAELETRHAKLRGCKDKSPGDLIRLVLLDNTEPRKEQDQVNDLLIELARQMDLNTLSACKTDSASGFQGQLRERIENYKETMAPLLRAQIQAKHESKHDENIVNAALEVVECDLKRQEINLEIMVKLDNYFKKISDISEKMSDCSKKMSDISESEGLGFTVVSAASIKWGLRNGPKRPQTHFITKARYATGQRRRHRPHTDDSEATVNSADIVMDCCKTLLCPVLATVRCLGCDEKFCMKCHTEHRKTRDTCDASEIIRDHKSHTQ